MVRYVTHDLSLLETEELMDWVGDVPERIALLQDIQETWDKTRNYPVSVGKNGQLVWNNFKLSVMEPSQPERFRVFKRLRYLLIAAVCLLLVGGSFCVLLYSRENINVSTGADEDLTLYLPDGTYVNLNANSELSYKSTYVFFNGDEISLKGSAFFKVLPDSKNKVTISFEHGKLRTKGAELQVEKINNGDFKVLVLRGNITWSLSGEAEEGIVLKEKDEAILRADGGLDVTHLHSIPEKYKAFTELPR